MEKNLHLGNVLTFTALHGGWLIKTVKQPVSCMPKNHILLHSYLIKNSILFISITCGSVFTSGHVSPSISENALLSF